MSATADSAPAIESVSREGRAGPVAPGAKLKRRGSVSSTDSEIGPRDVDDDDPLTYLCDLFGVTSLDDSDEESDESDESDESAPASPCAKALDGGFFEKKTYFYAMGRLYYHDEDHNIFLDNSPDHGILVQYGRQFGLDNDFTTMLEPDFFIDGVPYYFDRLSGALSYQDTTGYKSVLTWTGDASTFDQALNPTFVPRNAYYDYYGYPEVKADPVRAAPWSPGSSALSPILPTGSRASSEGMEPLIDPAPVAAEIQLWEQQTRTAQASMRGVDKMDRRRCPQCNKVFRRPCSLEDHLNVHSGAKPHVCPFEGCKTGFATKSNMKRHFLTHRVGTLEQQGRGIKVERKARATATYNSKAFHTQRFRLTGRECI